MKRVIYLVIVLLSAVGYAQEERTLPPSLQKELRIRGGKAPRIVSYSDTIKAQTLISRSIRDSSAQELDSTMVRDSAVVTIDTSVSLSHKQVLDSLLAELPEYERTPLGGRFKYPPEILVETGHKIVSFDTTILSEIEPVSREITPMFDALLLPRPIADRWMPRFTIDASIGSPSAPDVSARWKMLSSEHSSATIGGRYLNRIGDENAVRSLIDAGADVAITFSPEERNRGSIAPLFSGRVHANIIDRRIASARDSESTLIRPDLSLTFALGEPEALRVESEAHIHMLADNAHESTEEQSADVSLLFMKDFDSSAYRLSFGGGLTSVSNISTNGPALSLWSISAALAYFDIAPFEFGIGGKLVGISDATGAQVLFHPDAQVTFRPTDMFTIGVVFSPQEKITTLSALSSTNLFYSYRADRAVGGIADSNTAFDVRRVTSDNINASLFGEYFLSAKDNIRGEVRIITRTNEIVFDKRTDTLSKNTIFTTHAAETRKFEAELGLKLLIFSKDEFTAALRFVSATESDSDRALPYEPTLKAEGTWTFYSISEVLRPRVEFISIARKDRSLSFLNAELRYPIAAHAEIKLRAENIFGSAGDIWDGFNEYPRSIAIGIRAAF